MEKQTQKTSKVLAVSTTYARIAVMLLAFNFLLTGYLLRAFIQTQDSLDEGASYTAPVGEKLSTTEENKETTKEQ